MRAGITETGFANHRRECDRCGGAPSRAVGTRKIAPESAEAAYYLAFTWACSVCGNSWIDPGLERMNAQAERAARLEVGRVRLRARRAS